MERHEREGSQEKYVLRKEDPEFNCTPEFEIIIRPEVEVIGETPGGQLDIESGVGERALGCG